MADPRAPPRSWHELKTAYSNGGSLERKVGVRAGRNFPTVGMWVILLGELQLPSFQGELGCFLVATKKWEWDWGSAGAMILSKLPQYSGWIWDRGAARDALTLPHPHRHVPWIRFC